LIPLVIDIQFSQQRSPTATSAEFNQSLGATPAMGAGTAHHVWTIAEPLAEQRVKRHTYPSKRIKRVTSARQTHAR
jgi:hypothetical protein